MDARPFIIRDLLGMHRVARHARCTDQDVEPMEAIDGGGELGGVACVVTVREVEDMNLSAAGP